VGFKTNRAILMSNARERDTLTYIQIAAEQAVMAVAAMDRTAIVFESLLQMCFQFFVGFQIVRCVAQDDLALAVDSHSIIWIRQILRCQPEVKRVPRHQLKGETRSDRRSPSPQRDC